MYEAAGDHRAVDFNRDGTKLVVSKYTSASFSQLFEVTLATGEKREITPKGEEWSFDAIGYDATDHNFIVNTDYKGDLNTIHTIDLQTGMIKPVLTDLAGREIDYGTLNEDHRFWRRSSTKTGMRRCTCGKLRTSRRFRDRRWLKALWEM